MTEEDIFEYLKTNLYLDYDKDWYGNSLTVKLKLRSPGDRGLEVELGSVYIDIPTIEVKNGSFGGGW